MYCIEESTCDIAGTFLRPTQWFGAPTVIWRPSNCVPLGPLVCYAKHCLLILTVFPRFFGKLFWETLQKVMMSHAFCFISVVLLHSWDNMFIRLKVTIPFLLKLTKARNWEVFEITLYLHCLITASALVASSLQFSWSYFFFSSYCASI